MLEVDIVMGSGYGDVRLRFSVCEVEAGRLQVRGWVGVYEQLSFLKYVKGREIEQICQGVGSVIFKELKLEFEVLENVFIEGKVGKDIQKRF